MHNPIIDMERPPQRSAREPLVSRYRASSPFFFASTDGALLAHESHAHCPVEYGCDDGLPQYAQESLRRLEREHGGVARLALALPFSRDEVARGFLLTDPEISAGPRALLSDLGRASLEVQAGYTIDFQPTPRQYLDAVSLALRRIAAGPLEKVVLGRQLTLGFAEPVDCAEWLRRFYAQNASGYVFALDLAPPGAAMHKLMGASPELLLHKSGARVVSNPLAGSRPRGRSQAEDQEHASALLRSEKDHREHALVVAAVAGALAPFCAKLTVPQRPSLLSTPTMWHLSSVITGQLHDPGCSSLALVQALHPTPAVAGAPREQALALIRELEGRSRGPFAGVVGHCDARGDGEWAVTLRCAELHERSARLFAGAGVVAGSEPWAELDETAAKFRTALRALGVPLLSGAS